jgi:hypothetical protein
MIRDCVNGAVYFAPITRHTARVDLKSERRTNEFHQEQMMKMNRSCQYARRSACLVACAAMLMAAGCDSGPSSAPSKPASSPPPQANKPALPIKVTFEPVKDRPYLKAIYENESTDAYEARVSHHPTMGEDEGFDLAIGPKAKVVRGDPYGAPYFSGDEITINEANHAPLKIKVP